VRTVIQYTFERVPLTVSKTGKCPECGERVKRATTFYQTINPYNKTEDGRPKTYKDIYPELQVEADEWRKIPPVHARCEP
jgi:hypothetical protein